jgi:hypothetical protein
MRNEDMKIEGHRLIRMTKNSNFVRTWRKNKRLRHWIIKLHKNECHMCNVLLCNGNQV